MFDLGAPPGEVAEYLEKVLASAVFRSAERSSRIFRFVIEQALAGNADRLKEFTIGAEALGRGENFDPRIDSIVRVEVSRLRGRLDHYYATEGAKDALQFELPKGSYVPLIRRPASEPEIPSAAPPEPQTARPRWPLGRAGLWLAGAAALSLAAAAWALSFWRPPASIQQPSLALEVELWPDGNFANVVGTQLAIAPDSSAVVFAGNPRTGGSALYLRRLDGTTAVRLPGTEGARGPFFSPNGEWVAFWSKGKLRKVPLQGGSPITLCDAPDLLGGSWGDDGNIVATLTTEAKLWRVPASGGKPVPVLDQTPEVLRFLWPQVLPGSQAILFSNFSLTPDSGTVEWLSLRDGSRRTLIRNGVFGRYLPSGHLLYVNQGSVYAQRFNPATAELSGSPVVVLNEVESSPTFGFAQFDVSAGGTLVYRKSQGSGQFVLQLLTGGGSPRSLTPSGDWLWPRWSPDGKQIAVTRMESGASRIFVADVATGRLAPLSSDNVHGTSPLWPPNGQGLFLQGRGTLDWIPFTAQASRKTLLKGGVFIPWSMARDGSRLAYCRLDPSTHFDLWTVPLTWTGSEPQAGTPEPLLRTSAVETYPALSPDGRWVAYVSMQSGSYEVYVRPYGRDGAEVQVSKGSGRLALWSQQPPEIIYQTDDHRLMAAGWSVRDGAFTTGEPKPWGPAVQLGDTGVLPNFDVSPNGDLVALMPPPGRAAVRNQVVFRTNFFAEIERRLSTSGK